MPHNPSFVKERNRRGHRLPGLSAAAIFCKNCAAPHGKKDEIRPLPALAVGARGFV